MPRLKTLPQNITFPIPICCKSLQVNDTMIQKTYFFLCFLQEATNTYFKNKTFFKIIIQTKPVLFVNL